MISWLQRLVCLAGFGIILTMLVYYSVVHHGAAEAVTEARYNLVETMLIYVGGCLLLFISGVPQLLWKIDKHAFWHKVYLVGLVASFPGIGLGLMLLIMQMPK
ncbi:MAG: hypothetical protein PVF75_04375 [Granulosicoccaceae bacterium]